MGSGVSRLDDKRPPLGPAVASGQPDLIHAEIIGRVKDEVLDLDRAGEKRFGQ